MNTANPAPSSGYYWPTSGAQDPALCLDATSTTDPGCAYDYGWQAAANALSTATSALGGSPQGIWWLDVETGNTWNGDASSNAADLQGSIDYLLAQHVAGVGRVLDRGSMGRHHRWLFDGQRVHLRRRMASRVHIDKRPAGCACMGGRCVRAVGRAQLLQQLLPGNHHVDGAVHLRRCRRGLRVRSRGTPATDLPGHRLVRASWAPAAVPAPGRSRLVKGGSVAEVTRHRHTALVVGERVAVATAIPQQIRRGVAERLVVADAVVGRVAAAVVA